MTKYLNTKELSEYLGLSIPTLQRWRVDGQGIPFIKRGGIVRYDLRDIEAWLSDHKRNNTVVEG
jgi:excisionase family DNA binding protein